MSSKWWLPIYAITIMATLALNYYYAYNRQKSRAEQIPVKNTVIGVIPEKEVTKEIVENKKAKEGAQKESEETENKIERIIINENYFVMTNEEVEKTPEEDNNFGIVASTISNTKRALTIIPRIKNNPKLGKACRLLRDNNIKIYIENEFKIGTSWVNIDINATDQKIIDFLNKDF